MKSELRRVSALHRERPYINTIGFYAISTSIVRHQIFTDTNITLFAQFCIEESINQMKKKRSRQKEKILLEPVLTTALSRGHVICPGPDIFNYFSRTIIQIYLYDLNVNATGPSCYLSGNQR